MKFLNKYLIVTSVIFHLVLIASLFWILPYYGYMNDTIKTNADSRKQAKTAIVKDITEFSRNGLNYRGYLVNVDGQDLYISGVGNDAFALGEEINILVSVHPFKDIQTLTVIGVKK
jgi:hypothetical protein